MTDAEMTTGDLTRNPRRGKAHAIREWSVDTDGADIAVTACGRHLHHADEIIPAHTVDPGDRCRRCATRPAPQPPPEP